MEQLDLDIFNDNKKRLKQYSRIKKRIERLEEKLARIDDDLYSIPSLTITDMPKGNGSPRTIDDILVVKEETTDRINRLVLEAREIRSDILKSLDKLDDYRHCEVLELFFIDDYTLEEIAEELDYSVRHTIRIYKEGLMALEWQ